MEHRVYLGLGSNQGNRHEIIASALEAIEQSVGSIERISQMIETEPWGFVSSFCFVNAVVEVKTELDPIELLDRTQQIERALGRRSKSVGGAYQDRPIDIDILLYGDLLYTSERLEIPHRLLHQRRFVLESLCELIPEQRHPRLGKTFQQLYEELGDQE